MRSGHGRSLAALTSGLVYSLAGRERNGACDEWRLVAAILSMGQKKTPTEIRPRFRIVCGPDIAIGPGKAELLEHLQQTRSIAHAAKRMKMSYMRAWTLIKTMERCFKQPLVRAARGGAKGGGAALTETGQKVLTLYHRLETESLQATQATWSELRSLLRD